jgi:hypothetical protein
MMVTNFYEYRMRNKFTLVIDNFMQKAISSPSKGLPIIATARLKIWVVTLQAYDYVMQHFESSELYPADALSWSPSSTQVRKPGVTCGSVMGYAYYE